MNFFESELRKLFDDSVVDNVTFVGRSCYGDIGDNLRCKAQFITQHSADNYTALLMTILDRQNGEIDRTVLNFGDIWGEKKFPSKTYFAGTPHIWDDRGTAEWYAYTPSAADYNVLRDNIVNYLNVFRAREDRKPSIDAQITQASSRSGGSRPVTDMKDKEHNR